MMGRGAMSALPIGYKAHLRAIADALRGVEPAVVQLVGMVRAARDAGRRLWILGNGGSMAIAQHCAQDLLKCCAVRAQSTNDPSVLTAYANDHAFEYAFYSPLLTLRDPDDPVLIFSCSGKSRNYTEFVSSPVHPLAVVVGTDGGFLKARADVAVHVRSRDYQVCETAFQVVADLVVKALTPEEV